MMYSNVPATMKPVDARRGDLYRAVPATLQEREDDLATMYDSGIARAAGHRRSHEKQRHRQYRKQGKKARARKYSSAALAGAPI